MESAVSQILRTAVPLASFTIALDDTTANTTRTEENTTCEFSRIRAHPVFIVAYSLVFLVSLVLNCITMRVYFCTNQRVQSSITVYMKNLAAADFFICLSLLLRIVSYANNSEIMFNIYCSFAGATLYASILFMDTIAVNRYTPNACCHYLISQQYKNVIFFLGRTFVMMSCSCCKSVSFSVISVSVWASAWWKDIPLLIYGRPDLWGCVLPQRCVTFPSQSRGQKGR